VCFQLLREIGAKHRYRVVNRADLAVLKTMSYPERLQYLGVPMLKLPLLGVEARRHYRALQENLRPFPKMREALHRLKERGCSLHILSSNAVANIRLFLDRHELNFFDSITCERSFFGKHIGLRRFLQAHGLSASDIVYLADELRDVDACRRIGVKIVSAAWGFDLVERLREANPGLVAQTPAEACEIIERLAVTSEAAGPGVIAEPEVAALP
jgi:phosphoglycolate phosphatase